MAMPIKLALASLPLEFYLVVLLLLPALSMTEHILLHYLSIPATVKMKNKKIHNGENKNKLPYKSSTNSACHILDFQLLATRCCMNDKI